MNPSARDPATAEAREMVRLGFDALAGLYYATWGEYFHLAIFDDGDDLDDLAAAYERTHRRYFDLIGGSDATRILDVCCGGGAFSAWLANQTAGEVVGIDFSAAQLAHAARWRAERRRKNLRFFNHDVFQLSTLGEPTFDAAVCLDAACYFPDRQQAVRQILDRLKPGGRLLVVDWCRSDAPRALERELLLEPLCRAWAMPMLESPQSYGRIFTACGARLCEVDDLSERVAPNWERGYRASLAVITRGLDLRRLVDLAINTLKHGAAVLDLAKRQLDVALLSKAAADAGVLRYVAFVAEARGTIERRDRTLD